MRDRFFGMRTHSTRLVGRGNGYGCPRFEIVVVHILDELGVLQQTFGTPQRIIKILAPPFELSSQAAVDNQKLRMEKSRTRYMRPLCTQRIDFNKQACLAKTRLNDLLSTLPFDPQEERQGTAC